MPVHENEHTTSTPDPTTSTGSLAQLPTQHTFHQHLREQIRSAVQVVMEEVMHEELSHFLQAEWGESSPKRQGYRNGSYTRDLTTSSGKIEDLQVPRDREGKFQTQVFERYNRYEPQVAEGLTQMFISPSEHAQSWRSGPNAHGSYSQCQHREPSQPVAY